MGDTLMAIFWIGLGLAAADVIPVSWFLWLLAGLAPVGFVALIFSDAFYRNVPRDTNWPVRENIRGSERLWVRYWRV